MADEEIPSSGMQFAFNILAKWERKSEISQEVRIEIMEDDPNIEVWKEFISILGVLWLDLQPYVVGNSKFATKLDKSATESAEEEFMSYESFFYNPDELMLGGGEKDKNLNENKFKRTLRLEFILMTVIHRLGITKFGTVRNDE